MPFDLVRRQTVAGGTETGILNSIVCFNPYYCKYISEEEKENLQKVGSQRVREYTVEYINEFIQTAGDGMPIRAAISGMNWVCRLWMKTECESPEENDWILLFYCCKIGKCNL